MLLQQDIQKKKLQSKEDAAVPKRQLSRICLFDKPKTIKIYTLFSPKYVLPQQEIQGKASLRCGKEGAAVSKRQDVSICLFDKPKTIQNIHYYHKNGFYYSKK